MKPRPSDRQQSLYQKRRRKCVDGWVSNQIIGAEKPPTAWSVESRTYYADTFSNRRARMNARGRRRGMQVVVSSAKKRAATGHLGNAVASVHQRRAAFLSVSRNFLSDARRSVGSEKHQPSEVFMSQL